MADDASNSPPYETKHPWFLLSEPEPAPVRGLYQTVHESFDAMEQNEAVGLLASIKRAASEVRLGNGCQPLSFHCRLSSGRSQRDCGRASTTENWFISSARLTARLTSFPSGLPTLPVRRSSWQQCVSCSEG